MMLYLTSEQIIMINKRILADVKIKKADSFKVLSHLKIMKLLENVENTEGNIYDKAVVLLKGMVQEHPFASGNRRTAMLATITFLQLNNAEVKIKEKAKVLQGVREDYYSNDKLKEWLMGGDIHEFKR